MFNDTLSAGSVEKIASKPIRWSVAVVAIALISSLALNTIIGSVGSLQFIYNDIISQQDQMTALVLAAAMLSRA